MNGSRFLALETAETLSGLRGAIELGARGFFLWPSERAALADAAAGSAPTKAGPPPRRASVVAVYGPRGGVGATFVATHLAAALARSGRRTILIDADWRFADLTVALGAPDDQALRTVEDLEPLAGELEEQHPEEVLWRHPAGFDVLLAPGSVDLDGRGPEAYGPAIQVAAGMADAVVAHVGRPIDGVANAVMQACERVLLVLTLDVLAFRDGRRAFESLQGQGLASRLALVINRATRADISAKDAERAFGTPPVAVIPQDRRVGRVQDRGLLLGPGRRSMRAVARLAVRVGARDPEAAA